MDSINLSVINGLEAFEMVCWLKMEISWKEKVINEEVLAIVGEKRCLLSAIENGREDIGSCVPTTQHDNFIKTLVEEKN